MHFYQRILTDDRRYSKRFYEFPASNLIFLILYFFLILLMLELGPDLTLVGAAPLQNRSSENRKILNKRQGRNPLLTADSIPLQKSATKHPMVKIIRFIKFISKLQDFVSSFLPR